jgi:hypothetical protein
MDSSVAEMSMVRPEFTEHDVDMDMVKPEPP